MPPDYSEMFHQSSKDLSWGGRVHIPKDSSLWPEEWKTTHYKVYPRFPVKKLPAPKKITLGLSKIIEERKSERNFSKQPISSPELSTLLKKSLGTTNVRGGQMRRAYPSGGACFPIEVYPVILNGDNEIPSGIYHYNPKSHDLSVLQEKSFTPEDISQLTSYEWVSDASMLLIFTAVFARTKKKYGERGYRYILLEAGHMGENVYLASNALSIKCCGLGGTRDAAIEALLSIDGVTESVVYGLVLGN